MSLFNLLSQAANLTERETAIQSYVLQNPQLVSRMTSRELAGATYSSAATVTRFCRKLGCTGFTDFRIRMAAELAVDRRSGDTLPAGLTADCSLDEVRTVVRSVTQAALEQAETAMTPGQIQRVLSIFTKSCELDVYSMNEAFSLADYACRLLQRAGKTAASYGPGEIQLDHAFRSSAARPALFISRTGEAAQLAVSARTLTLRGVPIISVTGDADSAIAQLSSEAIVIPCAPSDDPLAVCQFATGVKYFLDVVYAALYTGSFADNENKARESRSAAEQLRMLPDAAHGEPQR